MRRPRRGFDAPCRRRAVGAHVLIPRADLAVQGDHAGLDRLLDLTDIAEGHALARFAVALHGKVVEAEHDVLGRNDDRLAVGRRQDVVCGHHENARLELGLEGEGHVDGHLVAVEIGVEGRADQRMELDRLALDEHRLEGLDAEPVQGRRAVEQHRVLADHFFEDVPHLGPLLLDHALGGLDGRGHAVELELRIDEGLEQLERHLLRQAALVQPELRADHDHRAARVIDALAEKVLAETALLALEHVGERLEWALVGTRDDPAAAPVVEQGIDRFLEHALLVAHDDLRRAQLDQPLQAVVAVDHPAVEVVQIRRREPAAVEWHQRAQLGRDDRNHLEDHPLGPRARLDERLDDLQALDELLALGLGARLLELHTQFVALGLELDHRQHGADSLGPDTGVEGIDAKFVDRLLVILLAPAADAA